MAGVSLPRRRRALADQAKTRQGGKKQAEAMLSAPALSTGQFVHRRVFVRRPNSQFASAIRRARRADRTPLVGNEMGAGEDQ